MNKRKVIFSHGKESGPDGTKINRLRSACQDAGFESLSVDYRDIDNPERRVEKLKQVIAAETVPPILAGSSMGGYVSTVVASQEPVHGLFLLAPALYLSNYEQQAFAPKTDAITIVYGWEDEVIPLENVLSFSARY